MSNIDTADSAGPVPSPVALFGIDESGKPHCSYFMGGEAERAAKAAEAMGMHVLPLAGPECDGLVGQMPQGRIFEKSGKAFVPFCRQPLYDRLAALKGLPAAVPTPKAAKSAKVAKPAKAAAAGAGGEQVEETGGRKAKKAAATRKPDHAPYVEPENVPQDWPHVRDRSLVLATTGEPAAGWFEATVVEQKDDGLLVLQWRDFEDALFLRRRNQVALLPEGTPLNADA